MALCLSSCSTVSVGLHRPAAQCQPLRPAAAVRSRCSTPCSTSTSAARPWSSHDVSLRHRMPKLHAAAPDASGAPAGQVSAALVESMRAKIGEALDTDMVTIADVYGDGRHVSIDVVSDLFEGKNSMQRQRMVYKAIWEELQGAVHAVDAMTTKTRKEMDAEPIRG